MASDVPWAIQALLDRKYAIMQQGADATTQNANTNALTAAAQVRLTNTQAAALPAESASQIALQRQQAALTRQQAAVVAPESAARIRGIDADVGLTRANTGLAQANTGLVGANTDTVRRGLREFEVTDDDVLGTRRRRLGIGSLPSLTSTLEAQRPGESYVNYMDRLNFPS